jgi:hypothetical protein
VKSYAFYSLISDSFLVLLFASEDGNSTILRNIGKLLRDYAVATPEDSILQYLVRFPEFSMTIAIIGYYIVLIPT